MVKYNNKILTEYFHDIPSQVAVDDGGGGGSRWEMDLDSEAMGEASTSYTQAASEYKTALGDVIKALNDLEGAWEGDAVADWKASATNLGTSLEKVGATLEGNATNVSKIKDAIAAVEEDMSSKVGSIKGS